MVSVVGRRERVGLGFYGYFPVDYIHGLARLCRFHDCCPISFLRPILRLVQLMLRSYF